jgi:uncharacterized Zn-finger protein
MRSLMLRPAVKRTIEQIFSRGEYLWDRNRLEEESSTASIRCIMARGLPKRLKQNLSIPSFVPTHVM